MKILIAQLIAASMVARDWHYNAKGASFYAEHLLADEIASYFGSKLQDDIIEAHYLGEKREVPPSAGEFHKEAQAIYDSTPFPKNDKAIPSKLIGVLEVTAAHAEELSRNGRLSIGTKSLLDEVSRLAYKSVGLITRTIM